MSRWAWWRQPIEKTAALTSPPQRKARPVSSHAERGSRGRGLSRVAVVNGARSFSTGHWVESEVIGERFAASGRPPAWEVGATLDLVEASRDDILKALEQVIDPELRRPVTELDMVRDLELHDGVVSLTIVLTVAGCPLRDSFEQQVEQATATSNGTSR